MRKLRLRKFKWFSHGHTACQNAGHLVSHLGLSAISLCFNLHDHCVFPLLNFLLSKHYKYSPWISVGNSHGMIFPGINCFHLLQGTYHTHRFSLFYYQWTFHREEQDGKEWIYTSSLVLSCTGTIIYLHVYFSFQTLSKMKRLFLV